VECVNTCNPSTARICELCERARKSSGSAWH